MSIKMAANSQLSKSESKKQKQTEQTKGTESQIWRLFGGLSVGKETEEYEGKVQKLRSITGRYKTDKGC